MSSEIMGGLAIGEFGTTNHDGPPGIEQVQGRFRDSRPSQRRTLGLAILTKLNMETVTVGSTLGIIKLTFYIFQNGMR